jgi:hypothetical protein
MEIFQKLGAEVEILWREKNYNEDLLPEIAAKVLTEFDIPAKMSPWEVTSWVLNQTELPFQQDLPARFSDVPYTVARFPRFHIDVYFWYNSTTAIHQHGFCGAFQVFEGSSIHSTYEFEMQNKLNFFAEIGNLTLRNVELLNKGGVREIADGRKFIHALFHLDNPSVTLIIRTHRSPLSSPQFSYMQPGLAIDPFFEEPNFIKKLQTASMLLKLKRDDADEQIANWLKNTDAQLSYVILSNLKHQFSNANAESVFGIKQENNRFGNLLKIAKSKHGEIVDIFNDVIINQEKINEISQKRAVVTDSELRFFLAILMNVDDKRKVFLLIKERFPNSDPLDKVLDWTFDLSNTKTLGANVTNALGIQDFDDNDLMALEFLLKDLQEDEIRSSLANDYGLSDADDWLKNLPARNEKLRSSVVLQALFR